MTEARIVSLDEHARLDAAADWLDQEGELSETERQAFECWYADADNRAAYQRMARSMNWVDQAPGAVATTSAPTPTSPPTSTPTPNPNSARRRGWLFPSAIAASLVLVSGFWLFASFVPSPSNAPISNEPIESPLTLESTRGERRSQILRDGSQLVLNAQSEVQVSLSSNERRVELNQGQVFFNVAREEQRPFIVNAGEAQVRVLGTRFDIDRTPLKTTIAVFEGSVQVQADRSVVLKGGEQITIADGRLGEVETRALGTLPAWRSGWLDVDDEPLDQVVNHLQRYLSQEVLVPVGALAEQSVSGRFSLDRPYESLQLLADTHGLTLEHDEQQESDQLRLIPAQPR